MQHDASHRLATYGTLGPGRPNHHVVAHLKGRWLTGTVRGRLVEAGWGAAEGFPGIVLDDNGTDVAVDILESADLPDDWARLDAFEGAGYCRETVMAATDDGPLPVSIYSVIVG